MFHDDGTPLVEPNPDSLITMADILAGLRISPAGNRILLADCCRTSPNAARGSAVLTKGRAFGANLKITDLPENTAAFFACSANEQAFEHSDSLRMKLHSDLGPRQRLSRNFAYLRKSCSERKFPTRRDVTAFYLLVGGKVEALRDGMLFRGELLIDRDEDDARRYALMLADCFAELDADDEEAFAESLEAVE